MSGNPFSKRARTATSGALRLAIDQREDDLILDGTFGALILDAAKKELERRRTMFRHVPITRDVR